MKVVNYFTNERGQHFTVDVLQSIIFRDGNIFIELSCADEQGVKTRQYFNPACIEMTASSGVLTWKRTPSASEHDEIAQKYNDDVKAWHEDKDSFEAAEKERVKSIEVNTGNIEPVAAFSKPFPEQPEYIITKEYKIPNGSSKVNILAAPLYYFNDIIKEHISIQYPDIINYIQ